MNHAAKEEAAARSIIASLRKEGEVRERPSCTGGADYSTLTRVQSQKRNRIHRTGVNKAKLDCSTTGILQEYGEYG